jgi:hypothetical protein
MDCVHAQYHAATTYSICPLDGSACLATGSLSSPFMNSVVQLTAAGGYNIHVASTASPNAGPFKADDHVCNLYANRNCIARCRTCTRALTATCYYNAPDQLAAAIAASPTGGAGSTDGTLTGAALTFGTPFAPSSFGASLPLQAGQTLNPRCQLTSLTSQQIYLSNTAAKLVLTLPTDGTSELVIYQEQCAALTPAQIAALTTVPPNPYSGNYLTPAGPAICKGVVTYQDGGGKTAVDRDATDYLFGGDITAVVPDSSYTSLVCGSSSRITGPVVQLPAASWQTSTFTVTASHKTLENVCLDDSCVGGNADGGCSACSYTYSVRFACNTPAPTTTPTTSPTGGSGGGGQGGSQPTNGGGIIGDPQFVGLRGQKYQVGARCAHSCAPRAEHA